MDGYDFNWDRYRTGSASVDILNGKDFFVDVQLQGFKSFPVTLINRHAGQPRSEYSYALICSKSKESTNKFKLFESGQRQKDDFLVHFHRGFFDSSTSSHHFNDPHINITYLQFVSNVNIIRTKIFSCILVNSVLFLISDIKYNCFQESNSIRCAHIQNKSVQQPT